jgi:hypothetical protein
MDVDENGWVTGKIEPLALESAWSLFAPEAEARVDAARWAHHARKFFSLELTVIPTKTYPTGGFPLADACEVEVRRIVAERPQSFVAAVPLDRAAVDRQDPKLAPCARAWVVTVPLDRAAGARAAALAIARGPSGGGFEALVLRAKRLWQIAEAPTYGDDLRAPLALAAVLASVLLAPIVPPRESAIFGVKTARERLTRLGYAT